MECKISIVIPTFNREATLPATLDSIRAQTDGRWECILIDDGSSDGTLAMLEETAQSDARFRWASRNKGSLKGANACRNQGAEMAQGDYLLFLDSDDLITPDLVASRLQEVHAHPTVELAVFSSEVRKESQTEGKLFNVDPVVRDATHYVYQFLTDRIPWLIMSPLWKKRAFVKLGGFDPKIQRHQDAELHIRALLQGISVRRFDGPADNTWLLHQEHAKRGTSYTALKLDSTLVFLERVGELLEKAGALAGGRMYWQYFYFRVYKDVFCFHPGVYPKQEAQYWKLVERFAIFNRTSCRHLRYTRILVGFRMRFGKRWFVGAEQRLQRTFENGVNALASDGRQ